MSTAQGAYGSGDSREFGANEWANASWRRGACGGSARWSGFEIAFDEWKSAELARLEAERRKLEDAHREFSEFVEHIRRAKDREEFERFMNERRAGSSPQA